MATTNANSCYIVIFQIAALEKRSAFREALKEFPGYCPLSNSAWAITSPKKAAAIRNELKALLASGDRMYVIKSGGAGAWSNAIGDSHSEWLKKWL